MRNNKTIERDYNEVLRNYEKYDETKMIGFELAKESKRTFESFKEFKEDYDI